MAGHQPKELTELAFASFTAYMKDKALQLLNWMEDTPTSTDEATKTCRELKDFFHGTRLPPVLANEITKRLLMKLDMFSVIFKSSRKDYFRQNLLPLVEVFLHPDVTSIELGPGYLHGTRCKYCKFIVTMIQVKIASLKNLKTLTLDLRMAIIFKDMLVLPSQLKELTLCGFLCSHKDSMKSIVECCRELKSLKIMRCGFADISVPHLLKLNRLETLHLFGDYGHWLDVDCAALINGISTEATSDVLSGSTLKSLGIELRDENTLQLIVDKLPHLTEIDLHLPSQTFYFIDLSCLTQLKNLRSLTLEAETGALNEYKKILPVLGESLVSLDLRSLECLDLEFIGETCSKLRCLHVAAVGNDSAVFPKASLKSFPNFRSVECLKVKMYRDYGWTEFIIIQCVNVKVLSIVYDFLPNIIESILKRISLTNLEEKHLYPEVRTDNTCLEELCLKCPNLRLVHGLGSDRLISRRDVFDFYGCRKNFCYSYRYSLFFLHTTIGNVRDSTSDSENCSTSDSENYSTSDSENCCTSDSENCSTSDSENCSTSDSEST